MQSHVISSAQSILEFYILDPSLLLLNAVCVPEIHQLLDRRDELVILINRVVTRDIHIEPGAFLDDRQTDAASADNRDGFARDLIAKEWQKRMPRRPFLFAHQALALPHFAREHAHHEKRKLGGRFGKHVGGVRERDLIFVRVGAIDVVKADGNLRHDFERPLPCFEYFSIDRVAQRGDQPIDSALYLLDD